MDMGMGMDMDMDMAHVPGAAALRCVPTSSGLRDVRASRAVLVELS